MRCFILIALCFVLANANYVNKNRFQQLLKRYQNPGRYQNQGGYHNQNQYNGGNLFGSDDVDDYIDDYVDEIRRERMCEQNGQCPRNWQNDDEWQGGDNWQGHLDDEYDQTNNFEDIQGGRYEQDEGQWGLGGKWSPLNNDDEMDTTTGSNGLYQEVEDANVKLASRLYKQSKDEKDDKNTVVSPLSVQLALAALNTGARGNTKREIGRVIGGRLQKQESQQVFKTLVRSLKGFGQNDYSPRQLSTKIHPVTGIFLTQTTRAQQMFVQQVKRTLGANVQQCNFQRQPQQCRQMINRFVAQKTQGKINHIVPQDAITDNTKMIVVNALQLKAPWGRQVRQNSNTKEAKFYPLDTKKVKIVQVLETNGRFKYYEDELVKIVGLPTEQKQLTLYVIVPKDKDGLTDVEKLHLQDGVQLKQILDLADQRVRQVCVELPKFQIKHKIDVRRTLRKQGVTDAFDPDHADFSGITGLNQFGDDEELTHGRSGQWTQRRRNPFLNSQFEDEEFTTGQGQGQERKLHLNKFIHQTTIKITQQGITATTGSGSPFENTHQFEQEQGYGRQGRGQSGFESEELNMFDEINGFNRREQQTGGQHMVKANRAFAFAIKHNPTNQLVMVGRVIDAAQKKVNDVYQTINNVDQF